MTDQFDIQSLHGQYFSAEICFKDVVGRISVSHDNVVYLCHDNESLPLFLKIGENFGYKNVWGCDLRVPEEQYVINLRILPPPTSYHALFQEILKKRGPTWDVDGSYSVLPNEVMASIADFMSGIKVFEPKNLGK